MESRILSLEAHVRQLGPRLQPSENATTPYWDIVKLGDGVSPTATTFPEFDDETRTDRVFFRQATAGGELFLHQWDEHKPARATIKFEARAAFTALASILADGAGNYWVNVNGTITAYTASQHVSLTFKQGANFVQVVKDDANTDRLLFEVLLFDGNVSKWIQP